MTPPKPAEPPLAAPRRFRWRRLFQYRLRTLLVLTAVIAAWMSWWSYTARRQREAVAALQKAEAIISYDFETNYHNGLLPLPPGENTPKSPRYWPTWLVGALGVDYFADVSMVSLREDTTAVDLDHLQGLARVQWLDVRAYSGWDDPNVEYRDVADGLLRHVAGLSGLRGLWLEGTRVTDGGLKHIKGLTRLETLGLCNTGVTDAGLKHLQGLTALQDLNLHDTRVTDAGLEHLKGLTALQSLDLHSTNVTDAGLKHLAGLSTLRELNLRYTQVTDAGLRHLSGLTALQHCELVDTHVTDTGVARLQQSLPNCKIYLYENIH